MEYVTLGQAGPRVSRIAFGGAGIGGYDYGPVQDAASIAAIHAALDMGVTLFDVADVYGLGHSESVLGEALRRGGVRDAVIATKVGVRWDATGNTTRDSSAAWIRQAVDGSLRRLRVECVDLYQLHWPDASTPIEETVGALLDLQQRGKIRHIGCCNFPTELLERVSQLAPIVSTQLPYNVAEQSIAPIVRDADERLSVPTLAYNVLAHGLFSGKFGESAKFNGTDLRRRSALFAPDVLPSYLKLVQSLREVGSNTAHTPCQVAIRWVLQQPGVAVALTGAKTPAQIVENAGASDWSLSPEEQLMLTLAWERLQRRIPKD